MLDNWLEASGAGLSLSHELYRNEWLGRPVFHQLPMLL